MRPEDKNKRIRITCSQNPTSSQKTKSIGQLDKSLSNFLDKARETFEANLLTDSYKNAVINIYITIVQSHGSLRCVILNAISLALVDAGIEMKDIVVSCSTGLVSKFPNRPVVDLSSSEEISNKGMLTLGYSPNKDKLLIMEMTNGKIPLNDIMSLTDSSVEACKKIYNQLKQFLRSNYALKSVLSKPI
jgi:exosome complex component RRP41